VQPGIELMFRKLAEINSAPAGPCNVRKYAENALQVGAVWLYQAV